jgi:hypothetical protein
MNSKMETQALSLSFRYSEHDYVQAMRTHYASRLRLPVDVAVIIGMIVFGIYEVNSGSKTFGIAAMVVSVLFALMLVAAFFVIPIYAFRSQPKFRDDYSLVFSPEGIQFRTANIDSNLQWSMYDRALIDAKSFILYYGKQQFTVIPKRVFGSAQQLEVFETMLRKHVPNVVVRP